MVHRCPDNLHASQLKSLVLRVLPGSDITIVETNYINDAKEISGFGTNSNGDQRRLLLIPCDDNHPGQCEDNSPVEVPIQRVSSPTKHFREMKQGIESLAGPVQPLRNRFGRGLHVPGQPVAPSN